MIDPVTKERYSARVLVSMTPDATVFSVAPLHGGELRVISLPPYRPAVVEALIEVGRERQPDRH